MTYPYETTLHSLGEWLGRNLRGWREHNGFSQDDVAFQMRLSGSGPEWTRATVAAIEAGTRRVSIEELLLLSDLLQVPPFELFRGAGAVWLSGSAYMPLRVVRARLEGRKPERWSKNDLLYSPVHAQHSGMVEAVEEILAKAEAAGDPFTERWKPSSDEFISIYPWIFHEAGVKAARVLGVEPIEVAFAAQRLWSRSLVEEREVRVHTQVKERPKISARSLQAIRGHVTRALTGELRAFLDDMGEFK